MNVFPFHGIEEEEGFEGVVEDCESDELGSAMAVVEGEIEGSRR